MSMNKVDRQVIAIALRLVIGLWLKLAKDDLQRAEIRIVLGELEKVFDKYWQV